MLEACRTCLRLIDVDNSPFFDIENDDMQLSTESCRYKLLIVIPEMALDITQKSMLCVECHGSLEALFGFKEKCLETENIVTQYLQAKPDLDIKNLDLKDVSAFNAAYFNNREVEAVKVSVEDDAIKEEVELTETIITNVKHEVDDFPSDSAEVAQPRNAVPVSSDDMNVSEDEADEVSVEDDAVKEEVEFSVTVITHVKHEVDDFPSERVEVAQPRNAVPVSSDDMNVSEDEALVEDDAVKGEVEFSETVITNVKHEVNNFPSESVEVAQPRNALPGSNSTCKYCNIPCKNANSLKIHLRTHTGEKPYRCEMCHRCFAQKGQLTNHLRIHTGEKPYRCEMCHRCFAHKFHLTGHLRTHTGEKPYRCEMCHRCFAQKGQLTTHLRTHTGEKPYRCDTCNRSFGKKSNLTAHLRLHTGERPYVCPVCDKACSIKGNLSKHMRTHNKEQPHQCKKVRE